MLEVEFIHTWEFSEFKVWGFLALLFLPENFFFKKTTFTTVLHDEGADVDNVDGFRMVGIHLKHIMYPYPSLHQKWKPDTLKGHLSLSHSSLLQQPQQPL